jgi:hypothetical protein
VPWHVVWVGSLSGYPVTARWQHNRDSASDRAAFKALIETLLQLSSTGAKIADLLASKR